MPSLDAILEPMVPRAAELGVRLRAEGPVCQVKLDPGRFTRVMVANIGDHALNATTDGGRAKWPWPGSR
ncbi:MAG: hypothetical protein IPO28_08225 [Holophagaceae bacterium]|nr:hypothetical protein [Holophagaceae bacterium]